MNSLQAGFARVIITPKPGIPLAGYYQTRIADGTLDELEANVLAVSAADRKALLISVDHGGLFSPVQKLLRARITEATGLSDEAIYLHSNHTHTGPIINLDGTDAHIAEYLEELSEKLVQASQAALADLRPARMGWGVGQAPGISFVRRYRMKDGSVQTNPGIDNPEIDHPLGTVDERVNVLRFDREGADSIVLVNFGCHPDTIGGCKFSADWPGFTRKRVEAALGNVRCLFMNGVQGDVNHVNPYPRGGQGNGLTIDFDDVPRGYAHAAHMGNVVAGAVLQVYEKVQYTDVDSVRTLRSTVCVPSNMPKPEDLPLARQIDALHQAGRDAELPYKGMMLTTKVAEAVRMLRLEHGPAEFIMPVSVVAVGPVAFVGIPGEPFTGVGLALKQAPGWDMVLPTCITNAKEGYFPMQDAYDEGGYEAASSTFAPGVAEILIEKSLNLLEQARA